MFAYAEEEEEEEGRGKSGVEMSSLVEKRKNPCMAFRCFTLAGSVDGVIW